MITRSLIIAVALVAAYSIIIIPVAGLPRKGITRHQDNIVRLETAVNVRRNSRAVLVGSSLAGQLESQWLGPGVTSLAVAGSGPETGLRIGRLLEVPPKYAVIELNYFYRREDPEILDYFDGSPLSSLRRRVPALWQYNHPLNLLLTLQQAAKARRGGGVDLEGPESRSEEAFQFALRTRLEFGGSPPEPKEVEEAIHRLNGWISELKEHGTEVVLSWFPTDARVRSAPYYRAWREAFVSAFPPDKNRWLEFPEQLGDRTVDGEHLNKAAAREAAQWLAAKLR